MIDCESRELLGQARMRSFKSPSILRAGSQIAMNDAFFVGGFERIRDLTGDPQRLLGFRGVGAGSLFPSPADWPVQLPWR